VVVRVGPYLKAGVMKHFCFIRVNEFVSVLMGFNAEFPYFWSREKKGYCIYKEAGGYAVFLKERDRGAQVHFMTVVKSNRQTPLVIPFPMNYYVQKLFKGNQTVIVLVIKKLGLKLLNVFTVYLVVAQHS